MEIESALGADIPEELRRTIAHTYAEIQKSYLRRNWKSVGIDAGHFVEAVRRVLDHFLFGKYKAIGKSLDAFNEGALQKYRDASGEESLRILVPRQLWALYALRNKRSMGHLGVEPALQIDANVLLHGSKWILAELIRLTSELPSDEALRLIDKIIEHQLSPIWREGEITRILNPKIIARDQVLILLSFVRDMSETELREIIEYKSRSKFRAILQKLHSEKLIEYSQSVVKVSPTGFLAASELAEAHAL